MQDKNKNLHKKEMVMRTEKINLMCVCVRELTQQTSDHAQSRRGFVLLLHYTSL